MTDYPDTSPQLAKIVDQLRNLTLPSNVYTDSSVAAQFQQVLAQLESNADPNNPGLEQIFQSANDAIRVQKGQIDSANVPTKDQLTNFAFPLHDAWASWQMEQYLLRLSQTIGYPNAGQEFLANNIPEVNERPNPLPFIPSPPTPPVPTPTPSPPIPNPPPVVIVPPAGSPSGTPSPVPPGATPPPASPPPATGNGTVTYVAAQENLYPGSGEPNNAANVKTALNVNAVYIPVLAQTASATSINAMWKDTDNNPTLVGGPVDLVVQTYIANGLDVILALVLDCADGTARQDFHPTDTVRFLQNLKTLSSQLAAAAARLGASAISIAPGIFPYSNNGDGPADYMVDWRAIYTACKSLFSGPVLYQATPATVGPVGARTAMDWGINDTFIWDAIGVEISAPIGNATSSAQIEQLWETANDPESVYQAPLFGANSWLRRLYTTWAPTGRKIWLTTTGISGDGTIPSPVPVSPVPAPPTPPPVTPPVSPPPVVPPVTPPSPPPVTPPSPPPSVPPSVHALTAGAMHTSGSQILDINNNPVRIAAVTWTGMHLRHGFLRGLDQVNYQTTMADMARLGFNAIRIPLCDAAVLNNDSITGINYTVNPTLQGLAYMEVLDAIVNYAGTFKMRIILASHSNEGMLDVTPNASLGQKNGIWYDSGGASDNTDGNGHAGNITDALFTQMWQLLANRYKGKTAILGYDIRWAPNAAGNVSPGTQWGDGSNTDILAMYTSVGNAIQAVDSNPLIICAGPLDYANGAYEGDLRQVVSKPVTLTTANKVVYAIQSFPNEVTNEGIGQDVGSVYVSRSNTEWGYCISNNVAPVMVCGSGDAMTTAAAKSWGDTFVSYLNGTADSGIRFANNQQAISWCWNQWSVSTATTPDYGLLSAWTSPSIRTEQATYITQLWPLTAPNPVPAPPPPAPPPTPPALTPSADDTTIPPSAQIVGSDLSIWTLVNSQVAVNGVVDQTTSNVIKLAYVSGLVWQENSSDLWYSKKVPSDTWSAATSIDPTTNQSSNGTTIPPATVIVGSDGTQWGLSGGQVTVNGTVDTTTANVIEMAYVNALVWQESSDNLWWYKKVPTDTWQPPAGTSTNPLSAIGPVPPPPAPPPAPAGTASLLPAGYLSTSGSQIVDQNGNPVRIASVGWNEIGNSVPSDIPGSCQKIVQAGFNCVRLPWYNARMSANMTTYDQVVSAAGSVGLKVIFDNHANEGGGACASQQQNGLWYDVGGASDGTDGCGATGTVSDAQFVNDWVMWATHYRNNPTVIGYDIRNEPLCFSPAGTACTWEAGSNNPNHNIRYMYERVANAIHNVDPNVLIICEGPQNYSGLLAGGTSNKSPWGDLSLAGSLPVQPTVPNKVVYSVHDYPVYVAGFQPDSGSSKVTMMNAAWGYLVKNNIAPVWIGEMGANFDGSYGSEDPADSTAWAQTLFDYMNGNLGSQGGPTFTGNQQGIGGDWWAWGNLSGQQLNGTQNSDGTLKQSQYQWYSKMFYRPAAPITPPAPPPASPPPASPPPPAPPPSTGYPVYDHIVICVMENHAENQIIGDTADAPYINSLVSQGILFTNFYAITHPSEPNYFALYAGDTFGVTDDNDHTEADPTMFTALQAVGKSFKGYVESGSPRKHNPWESFPEGFTVEADFGTFPSSTNYASLPTVSWVIPNLNDDMHDGTINQGDQWLQANLDPYIQWAKSHNSLFILTWDEDDNTTTNQIPTILVGAHLVLGNNNTLLNHYSTLGTILQMYGATKIRNSANVGLYPTNIFQQTTPPPVPPPSPTPTTTPPPSPPTGSPIPVATPQGSAAIFNFSSPTGKTVPSTLFGVSCGHFTDGPPFNYSIMSNTSFQNVMKSLNIGFIRLNWDLNFTMDSIFPSRGASPDWSWVDTFINNVKKCMNVGTTLSTANIVITVGYNSWLDITSPSDWAVHQSECQQLAQHFVNGGVPIFYWTLANEADGVDINSMEGLFTAMKNGVKAVNSQFKAGGLDDSWNNWDRMSQLSSPDFFSWHEYIMTSGSKTIAQCFIDALGVDSVSDRQNANSTSAPANCPLMITEANMDGLPDYTPEQQQVTGAVYAAMRWATLGKAGETFSWSRWDIFADSYYGMILNDGNFSVVPAGYAIQKLAKAVPGQCVSSTLQSVSGKVFVLGTVNGSHGTAQIINYDQSATFKFAIVMNNATTSAFTYWELSAAHPNGYSTSISSNALLAGITIPAMSIIVITY